MEEILFNPQTSGGLLVALEAAQAPLLLEELRAAGLPAQIVGEIMEKTDTEITVHSLSGG
jgi:selenide,water dikinase